MVKRDYGLDLLRAVAVILVLGRHMIFVAPVDLSPLLHDFTWIWRRGGWVGVDLFFVLSGFLISKLLFVEHKSTRSLGIGRFLIRRALRLYPPFWLMIAVSIVVATMQGTGAGSARQVISELLFVQNYFEGLWGHTWSLAVEEHFYLLLPLALAVLLRRPQPHAQPFANLPWLVLGGMLICLGARVVTSGLLPYADRSHLYPTHLRFDTLLFGVWLGYCSVHHTAAFRILGNRYRPVLWLLGLTALTPAFTWNVVSSPLMYTIGPTLFALGGGCLVVAAVESRLKPNVLVRGLTALGRHSYAVYLWHIPVSVWGVALATWLLPVWNWPLYVVVYLGGSLLVGVALSLQFDQRILAWRDSRFPPLHRFPKKVVAAPTSANGSGSTAVAVP